MSRFSWSEVQSEANDVVGAVTFDRTRDSPVGVFPERRAYRRTMALSDVWDNIGFDPATGQAMMTAAGNAALERAVDPHVTAVAISPSDVL